MICIFFTSSFASSYFVQCFLCLIWGTKILDCSFYYLTLRGLPCNISQRIISWTNKTTKRITKPVHVVQILKACKFHLFLTHGLWYEERQPIIIVRSWWNCELSVKDAQCPSWGEVLTFPQLSCVFQGCIMFLILFSMIIAQFGDLQLACLITKCVDLIYFLFLYQCKMWLNCGCALFFTCIHAYWLFKEESRTILIIIEQ